LTFSEILEVVSIDSGHLNYHLENLGDLITHSQDGRYELSSVGLAAVKLMGGVEDHSLELSKPRLSLTRIFTKVYPLILSGALIIACLYFISYTTSVTHVANGVANVALTYLPVANSTTSANQTAIGFLFNVTMVNATSSEIRFVQWAIVSLNGTSLNFTTSWEQVEKPLLYYGIAGLVIGLLYPGVALIDFLKSWGRKRKPRI
jgi:hypothetical protein